MKKLFAFIIAGLCACTAQAQTSKGTITLSATFGYSQQTGSADKELNGVLFKSESRNYTVAPSIGVFIKDNLELGATINSFQSESETLVPNPGQISSNKIDYWDKSYHLYARQYKFMTEKLAAHVTLSGGWRSVDLNSLITETYLTDMGYTTSYTKDDHHNTFSAAISPGVSFFATNQIKVNMNFGALTYSRHSVDVTYTPKDSRYSPSGYDLEYDSNILELDFTSMNLNIGLTYFLRKQ